MTEYGRQVPANNNMNFMQTLEAINNSMKMTNDLILKMNDELSNVKESNIVLSSRVDKLELTYEITRKQAKNINTKVKRLARELVGYPSYIYGVTIQDIYRYLREYYNLANAVGETEKQYYHDIIHGLEFYKTDKFDKQRLIDHKKSLDESKRFGK